MKTYSKKSSKHTERAECSSSSDDDRVGKEQPNPRKTPKRTRSSSEDDESDKRGRKPRRTNKDKPTDTSQKTASQKRKGKGNFSSKSVDFLLTFY